MLILVISINFISLQLLNISLISLTEYVSKLDILIEPNEVQLLSIAFIFFTNEVFNLDKSIDSNELQLLNIPLILITECVSKLVKLIDFNLQPLNIFDISVTFDVSKSNKPFIDSNELQLLNIS